MVRRGVAQSLIRKAHLLISKAKMVKEFVASDSKFVFLCVCANSSVVRELLRINNIRWIMAL